MTFESVKNALIADIETEVAASSSEDDIAHLLRVRSWLKAGDASISLGGVGLSTLLPLIFRANTNGTGYSTNDFIFQTVDPANSYAVSQSINLTNDFTLIADPPAAHLTYFVPGESLPTGASTAANQTTIIGHVDGIEGLLTTIDADTSTLAGAISGSEVQVDVVAPLPAGNNNIGDIDVLTLPLAFNTGTVTATTPRVTLATDDPTVARLGTNGDAASQTGSNAAQLRAVSEGLGLASDAAATSNTGTFSFISLFKRLLSRLGATRLYVATTIASSGDNTVIAAPAAGVRIVITFIRVQNNTTTATTVLFKDGASTTVARLATTVTAGSGLSETYGFGDEIRLSAATAFVVNLSGANTHGISIKYWLETVATGLPA